VKEYSAFKRSAESRLLAVFGTYSLYLYTRTRKRRRASASGTACVCLFIYLMNENI